MRSWISVSLLLLSINVSAQTPLNLEKCRKMALENNYRIANATVQQQKATYDYKAVRTNLLPNVSGYGYGLYTNKELAYSFKGAYLPTYVLNPLTGSLQPNLMLDQTGQMIIGPDGNPLFKEYAMIPPMDLKVKLSGTFTTGIKLEQPIFMGFKILTAMQMAKLGTEMASNNIALNHDEVIIETDEAWYQLVKVNALVKVAGKYLETVTALEKKVQDAAGEGLVMNNDLLKVQLKANEARLQLSKAQNGRTLASMNLCNIIGLSTDEPVEVLDEEFKLDETEINGSITDRPDYKLLEQQSELKRKQIKLIRSEFLPQAGVAATYGYMQGLKAGNTNLLQSANVAVIATVSIPIFHWNEAHYKVLSAKADLEMAENNRVHLNSMMHLEETKYRLSLQESVYQVQLSEKSLQQATENLKVTGDRYELGLETISGLLEAQTQWQKVSAELIEAQSDYSITRLHYLKSIGKLPLTF
jgi:outer membrane protein TolC